MQAFPNDLSHSNEVHVWRVFIGEAMTGIKGLREILSAGEMARARSFHFEKDRNRFVVARGMLRRILGCYLGKKPQDLRFDYTRYGKPFLATAPGTTALYFNLSHSAEIVLYAFSRSGDTGIDTECIRGDIAYKEIAQRFFTPGEINVLEQTTETQQPRLFYQYWTRKEAFLKAVGKGVSFPMEQCDVSMADGRVLSPVRLLSDANVISCWHVQDIFPADGYAAAIALDGADWSISCRDYPW